MNIDKAVAIVGIAGLFPGANNLEEFMELLENGQCQSKPIPKERFDTDKYYDENRNAPGKTYVKNASLVEGFEMWDHKFFDIGKKTAEKMDPQHKFALEVTFRALEDGGISLDDIKGSNTSVFMGQMNSDYKEVTTRDFLLMSSTDPVGQAMAILANQISFTFDLRGESIALDTACSSSLIALHKGAQTILDGSSDMSICGGVNFILSPTNFMGLSKAGMISPKGICHSFSNKADGYGKGEGCGIVVLKSIEKAKKDGNKIWGYMVTGSNQDGHAEVPITAPSGSQQEKLIKTIYKKHDVKVENIGYIEAHGTGTPVGDPIEVKALGKALGEICPNRKETIYIGSVKSNIGHLESAAGVVGLIKLLLCMKQKKIVPSLHCEEGFNEKIPFEEFKFQVPMKVEGWESPKNGRRIGIVNCFGFGGSNSHAVVLEPETAIEEENVQQNNTRGLSPMTVAVSAKSREALIQTVQHFHQELLKDKEKYTLNELAWTSTCRRQHFAIPKAFIANSNEGLCQELEKWIKSPKIEETQKDVQNIWVFCGMGTHWKGMCKELMKIQHFAESMEQVDEVFQKLSTFSILEKIEAEEDFSNPGIGQPALFAMQVSLARLWQHWGIKPDVIIGHSVGEVAAAHIAGQLTLESAVKVIYHRGRLLERVKGGAMLVVGNFPVEEVLKIIDSLGDKVSMAAKNSPISCTLSGDETVLEEISSTLKSKKASIFLRKLEVKVAYHSKYMDPVLGEFQESLTDLKSQGERTKFISTVTGEEVLEEECCSGSYWRNNMRQSVLFDSAITTALDANKHNIVLEIGPRAALQSYIKDIASSLKVPFSMHPSVKPREEWITMQRSLGQIYEKGIKIDWKNVHNGKKMTPIPIPRYGFDKQDVYVLNEKAKEFLLGLKTTSSSDHLFIRPTNDENTLKVIISPDTTPFVYQHKLEGKALMPGATYGEILLTSAFLFWKEKYPIECMGAEVEFLKKVALENDKEEKELTVLIKEVSGRKDTLQCSILCGNLEHAGGSIIKLDDQNQGIDKINIKDIEKRCKEEITVNSLYDWLSNAGFSYGSSLRGIRKVMKSSDETIADIEIPFETQSEVKQTTALHPAILDTIFQLLMVFRNNKDGDGMDLKVLPVGIKNLVVKARVKTHMRIYMKVISQRSSMSLYNAVLIDLQGKVIAECEGITCMTLSSNISTMSAETKEYQLECVEMPHKSVVPQTGGPHKEESTTERNYLLVTEKVGQRLAPFMNKEEHRVKVLSPECLPKEWEQTRDMIELFVQNNNVKIEVMEAIIYIPETYNENEMKTKDGQDICRQVMDLSIQLQFLLKFCQMYSKQLIVVTEFGQPLGLTPQCDTTFHQAKPSPNINICHVPLWSFVRSYSCENPILPIKMIDIQDMNHPEELVSELLPPYEEPEIVLSQGKIYKVLLRTIDRRNSHTSPLKELAPVQGQTVQLKAMDINIDSCTKPHLSPYEKKLTGQKNDSHDLVKIQVTKAFLPVDALYPNAKESVNTRSCEEWTLDGPTTFPMLGMEFHGKMSRSEKMAEDVVVCYPLLVSSIIEVDQKYVIPQKKLPKNSKGYLWLLILAYEILKKGRKLKKKSKILILGDKNQELIIEKVLKACCEAMGVTVEDNPEKDLGKNIHLIVVLPTGISELAKAQPHLSKETSIIVLKNLDCVQEVNQKCWSLQETCQHIFHVDPLEVFRPADLSKYLPKVINWINSKEMKQLRLDIPTVDVFAGTSNDVRVEIQGTMRMVLLNNVQNIPVYASEKELFSRRACYIIVGGAKGLGMVTIEQMAERGAGFILCISRSKPTQDIKEKLDRLQEKWKTEIRCSSVDACDYLGLEKALQEFAQSHPGIPFKGIFFGAAVLDDCFFVKMTEEKFQNAVKPKVIGAWNMHRLSLQMNMDLNYFVLHSSIASILGNQGQTNYSAGNGFMDGLAHYRNTLGLCGQSINWGALDLGLFTISPETKSNVEKKSIYVIEKDEIAAFFMKVLLNNFTQIMICQFNIRQFALQINKHQPSSAAKLREYIPNFKFLYSSQENTPQDGLIVEELRNAEYPKAVATVKNYLIKLVKEIVNVDMATLADDTVFARMGVDSMAVSQIEQLLESDIKMLVKINPDTDTFENFSKNITDLIQIKDGQIKKTRKSEMEPFHTKPSLQEKGNLDNHELFELGTGGNNGVLDQKTLKLIESKKQKDGRELPGKIATETRPNSIYNLGEVSRL